MGKSKELYPRQPPYNEDLPSCPPSYSEATGIGFYVPSSGIQLEHSNQLQTPPPLNSYPVPAVPAPVAFVPNIIVPVCVGPASCRVQCPCCKEQVKTVTKSVAQKSAHIACLVLCLLGCCLCSCIPYFMRSFKDIHHYCPQCKAFIGSYKS